MNQYLWIKAWAFFKIYKKELPNDPAILFLIIIYTKKREENPTKSKGYVHTSTHYSAICNSQDLKQQDFSMTDKWIKTMQYTSTAKYYSAMSEDAIYPFIIKCMKLQTVMLCKITHKNKYKY